MLWPARLASGPRGRVFYQLILQQLVGGRLPGDDHARQRFDAGEPGCAPSTLADDDHVQARQLIPADPDWLELATLAEARG